MSRLLAYPMPNNTSTPPTLDEIYQRLWAANTLGEAKKWGFLLWHRMRGTREGNICPGCSLTASDFYANRVLPPPISLLPHSQLE